MKDKKQFKDKAYKYFLKALNDGEISIKDILNGYIEIREEMELMMDGASEAIEAYKNGGNDKE